MLKKLSIIAAVALLAASCKSPYMESNTIYETTRITSDPAGATVLIDGKAVGKTPCTVKLPTKITTEYSKANDFKGTKTVHPWQLTFSKDGYTEEAEFDPQMMVQAGGAYSIDYTFTNAAYMKDPTIMAGEADKMVSRDKPGETALESTIIRWYFDSEPRGARIYWRVVSSIPQVVKNTNETYLMTTPYEETRGFNILGLTYENSRDVTIEIKASKQGYEDQVKRFNVRQAIDQQEISGFFDLVPKGY